MVVNTCRFTARNLCGSTTRFGIKDAAAVAIS
jgi:hypothetical protein